MAVARPMPLAAPVTSARLPRMSNAEGMGMLLWLMTKFLLFR
jgi:hypothetical protein